MSPRPRHADAACPEQSCLGQVARTPPAAGLLVWHDGQAWRSHPWCATASQVACCCGFCWPAGASSGSRDSIPSPHH